MSDKPAQQSSLKARMATTKPQSAPPPAPCFLNLSPEIRNAIYELLFVQGLPLRLRPDEYALGLVLNHKGHDLGGLRFLETCRQVHAEAIPMLYCHNTFLIHHNVLWRWNGEPCLFDEWLRICDTMAIFITNIHVDIGYEGSNPCVEILLLLRYVWSQVRKDIEITFVRPVESGVTTNTSVIRVPTLNLLFEHLRGMTLPECSIYLYLGKTLKRILLHVSEKRIFMVVGPHDWSDFSN